MTGHHWPLVALHDLIPGPDTCSSGPSLGHSCWFWAAVHRFKPSPSELQASRCSAGRQSRSDHHPPRIQQSRFVLPADRFNSWRQRHRAQHPGHPGPLLPSRARQTPIFARTSSAASGDWQPSGSLLIHMHHFGGRETIEIRRRCVTVRTDVLTVHQIAELQVRELLDE